MVKKIGKALVCTTSLYKSQNEIADRSDHSLLDETRENEEEKERFHSSFWLLTQFHLSCCLRARCRISHTQRSSHGWLAPGQWLTPSGSFFDSCSGSLICGAPHFAKA